MFQNDIYAAVRTAEELIDGGDQGQAQALLTRVLTDSQQAENEAEAVAIAQATRMLIELDLGLVSQEDLYAHVERMDNLTEGFNGAEVETARAEAELQQFE